MKNKHAGEMEKLQSEYEADARVTEEKHQKKIDRWKAELRNTKMKLMEVGQRWENKLIKLENELSSANDKIVCQKSKYRDLMQRQMDEAKAVADQVQNYEDSFLQENAELRAELKMALANKRAAERQSNRAKQLAQS